jgi:hypothetical protein
LDRWVALVYLLSGVFAVAAVWVLWQKDGLLPTWRAFSTTLQRGKADPGELPPLGVIPTALISGLAGLFLGIATLRERATAARCLLRIRLVLLGSLVLVLLRLLGAFLGRYLR